MHTSDYQQLLDNFRAHYQPLTGRLNGHTWQYFDTATPGDTLLILPGNGGPAEALFPWIEGFAQHFRVIAPDPPASLNRIEQVTEGLRALLHQANIQRLSLFGMAYGGMLAQVFVRRYPELVDDVVMTHTRLPDPRQAEIINMQRSFMRLYPGPLLMWLANRRLQRDLSQAHAPATLEERAFWKTYYADLYRTRFGRSHLLSRARISSDYHVSMSFQSTDLQHWKGHMLIIESEYDDIISEGDRGALLTMYPRAFVQTLYGMSHLATILAAQTILSSSLNFLLQDHG